MRQAASRSGHEIVEPAGRAGRHRREHDRLDLGKRAGAGIQRYLDLGWARALFRGRLDHVAKIGLGLAVDLKREAERLARDGLARFDKIAGEVPLNPLTEERIGNADLQGVAIDPEPDPFAK